MKCIFCNQLLLYAHRINARIPANFHYHCLGDHMIKTGKQPQWNKDGSLNLNKGKKDE